MRHKHIAIPTMPTTTTFPERSPLLPKADIRKKIDQVQAALEWYYDLLDRVDELLIEIQDELRSPA